MPLTASDERRKAKGKDVRRKRASLANSSRNIDAVIGKGGITHSDDVLVVSVEELDQVNDEARKPSCLQRKEDEIP